MLPVDRCKYPITCPGVASRLTVNEYDVAVKLGIAAESARTAWIMSSAD